MAKPGHCRDPSFLPMTNYACCQTRRRVHTDERLHFRGTEKGDDGNNYGLPSQCRTCLVGWPRNSQGIIHELDTVQRKKTASSLPSSLPPFLLDVRTPLLILRSNQGDDARRCDASSSYFPNLGTRPRNKPPLTHPTSQQWESPSFLL